MKRRIPSKRQLETHEVDDSGDLIVHDPQNHHMVVLNPIGAATFALIDGKRDLAQIVTEIAAVFADTARSDIERDVNAFLDDLEARGLIESLPDA